jgi:hypothetical protein
MPDPKRKRRRGERTLITIHGIWTTGDWQERLEEVFSPHLHYESFKYSEFQGYLIAVFFLAMEWLAVGAGIAGFVIAWQRGWLKADLMHWGIAALLAISLVLIASFLADFRRDRVVTDFVNFVDKAGGFGEPPHFLAHSLGTFIIGRMLLRFSVAKAEKIVFFGCVLRPDFDWGTVRTQFQGIRNELGSRDWVSSITALLSPFIREMGPGGRKGFRKPPGVILTLTQQQSGEEWQGCECALCKGKSNFAVLNIEGQRIDHNNIGAVTILARKSWLPYLWDIPPARFESFVNLCEICDRMEEESNPDLPEKIDELLAGCWYWTRGPLHEFLGRILSALAVTPDDQSIRSLATSLFRTIAEANRSTDAGVQRLLFPMFAVKYSAKLALKERP